MDQDYGLTATCCNGLSICCYSTVTHYMTGYNASETIAGIIHCDFEIQGISPGSGCEDHWSSSGLSGQFQPNVELKWLKQHCPVEGRTPGGGALTPGGGLGEESMDDVLGGGGLQLTSFAWEKWLKRFGDAHRIHHFHVAMIKGMIYIKNSVTGPRVNQHRMINKYTSLSWIIMI